jgi:hypothetical protein
MILTNYSHCVLKYAVGGQRGKTALAQPHQTLQASTGKPVESDTYVSFKTVPQGKSQASSGKKEINDVYTSFNPSFQGGTV